MAKTKTGEVDVVAFGRFLGVEIDPGVDPVGFLTETRTKMDRVEKWLKGGQAAESDTVTDLDAVSPVTNTWEGSVDDINIPLPPPPSLTDA